MARSPAATCGLRRSSALGDGGRRRPPAAAALEVGLGVRRRVPPAQSARSVHEIVGALDVVQVLVHPQTPLQNYTKTFVNQFSAVKNLVSAVNNMG